MTVADVVRLFSVNPVYRERVVHLEHIPPTEPVYGLLDRPLPESLQSYLDQNGIRLYSHQCEAINHARAGRNVIITTPTASGKTLAFTIPVLEQIESDFTARGLYLYPTKALTNDQLATLQKMEKYCGFEVNPAVYDGDTPQSKRPAIRANARIILSNPHEIHQILSWHAKWRSVFAGLRFIVIDEAHRYRGVLGTNIAFLIRRLRRICRYYGSDPQFILSTATLANPLEFAENLTGTPFVLVDQDGSPHGPKDFALYNPFFNGIGERSMHQEAKDLLISCVKNDVQTLCFTGSRKMAELITLWAQEDARRSSAKTAESIAAYRAGYLPEERRALEQRAKSGCLMGIVSTNALELGIDIGSLDAVIISGYPGTMMSARQQAGRAGRSRKESLAILVAQANPLDQYFMNHPREFFSRSHEHAIIDVHNPYILSGHVLCAAAELPFNEKEDDPVFSGLSLEYLTDLAGHDLLTRTSRGWVYSGRGRAADAVRLDGIPGETFRILCQGRLLETMSREQAYREAHTGAIMLHQGTTYLVTEMDLLTHNIRVVETDVEYYTQPLKEVNLTVIDVLEQKLVGKTECAFGDVEVTEQYTGYKIKRGDTVLGVEPLSLPPLTFRTKAFWFVVPEGIESDISRKSQDFAGGLHGAEHAIIALMPLHVVCDRWDIGGLSSPSHGAEGKPVVFVYDAFEGGIGLSEKAFSLLPQLLSSSHELVRDCHCQDGCPSCIFSPKCGNDNQPLDKSAARDILGAIVHYEEEPPEGCVSGSGNCGNLTVTEP